MGQLISPEKVFARIKEELKSYYSTGSIDTLLFPIWTKHCLDQFNNTFLPLETAVIDICNYKADLPCDFKSVKELWVCGTINKGPITSPFTFYYQSDCRISTNADTCSGCSSSTCTDCADIPSPVGIPSLCGVDKSFWVTNKVQTSMNFSFTVKAMLKPGNNKTFSKCSETSLNRSCYSLDTFDIMGNKIVTSFLTGTLYLIYYADATYDESGNYEIPDNDKFERYLYHYLRQMTFQILLDQCSDESYRQLTEKRNDEERRANDARIECRNYMMSETPYSVQQSIVRSYNRLNKYRIYN